MLLILSNTNCGNSAATLGIGRFDWELGGRTGNREATTGIGRQLWESGVFLPILTFRLRIGRFKFTLRTQRFLKFGETLGDFQSVWEFRQWLPQGVVNLQIAGVSTVRLSGKYLHQGVHFFR